MKVCPKCGVEKAEEEFPFRDAAKTSRRGQCEPCLVALRSAKYTPHPRIPPQGWATDGVGYIPLDKGLVALVDPEDVERISRRKWWATWDEKSQSYRARNSAAHLHREVLQIQDSTQEVDHINHDTLDNRKENLRVSSHQENCCNRRVERRNTTGFKGVSLTSYGRYAAGIKVNGKRIHLGVRKTPEEAFSLYVDAAKKYHKEFAYYGKEKVHV